MQNLKKFLISLLSFISFTVPGAFFGFVLGIIFALSDLSSMLISWKLLDGTYVFTQIAGATSQKVWAQTEDGRLYSWNLNCYFQPKCNKWVEDQAIPDDLYEFVGLPMEKNNSCYAISPQPPKEPPEKVIECASGWYAGPEYAEVTYYVLSANGTIWALQTSSIYIAVVLSIKFSFGGLSLGIISFIVFSTWRRAKNKSKKIIQMVNG